jgi:outer membrane immunogenic protein
MKIVLAASAAFLALGTASYAADAIMSVPSAPAAAPVAATYNWSGFYVGAFGGVTTGDYDFTGTDGTDTLDLSVSGSGFLGGAQIGYDQQFGQFVLGAVADIAATNHEAEITAAVPGFGAVQAESTLKYLGTVRARAGFAMDDLLIYAHGGYAYGETEQTLSATGIGSVSTDNDVKHGFAVGAGVEYAVTDTISFQTEYSYTDLGDDEIFNAGGVSIAEDLSFHAVKVGVNFRF